MKKSKGGIFFRFIESSKKNKMNEISHSSFNKWRKNDIDFKERIVQNKSSKKLLRPKKN